MKQDIFYWLYPIWKIGIKAEKHETCVRIFTNSTAIEAILTKNDQETDEDGRQRAHAKLQRLTFLDQLAVLAPETVRTNATVSESRILVDAPAAVQAGIVDALVLVHAALVVRRRDPPFSAAAVETLHDRFRSGEKRDKG